MSAGEVAGLAARLDRLEVLNGRLENKIDALTEAVSSITSRCARNSERISNIAISVELAHSRISGTKKLIYGGLITVATYTLNHIWNAIQATKQ